MTLKEKQPKAATELIKEFGYRNKMEVPRIEKVVINTGTGSVTDKDKLSLIEDRLRKITGQKAAPRGARRSIASFKIREGDTIGYQATLRGPRMYDFLDRLINIALPRTKDFQGLKLSAWDNIGNYTIGLSEHTAFPETADEEIKNIFGLSITVVTNTDNQDQALALLKALGFPFQAE